MEDFYDLGYSSINYDRGLEGLAGLIEEYLATCFAQMKNGQLNQNIRWKNINFIGFHFSKFLQKNNFSGLNNCSDFRFCSLYFSGKQIDRIQIFLQLPGRPLVVRLKVLQWAWLIMKKASALQKKGKITYNAVIQCQNSCGL